MIPISHSQKYPELQDIYKLLYCLEILRVVGRGDVSLFQIIEDARGARGLL